MIRAARARRAAPDQRRADLLEAARRVLQERGYGRATVDDIVSAAGVAKGTFYLYFESKEALLDALREEFSRIVDEKLEALRIPDDRAGWDAFTADLVRMSVDMAFEHADLHDLLAHTPHAHGTEHAGQHDLHPALNDARDVTRASLERIIRAGVDAGAYRADDPGVTAHLLFDLIHAACEYACEQPNDRERITRTATGMVRGALGMA
jgi:AcrR family transcriptional regulator